MRETQEPIVYDLAIVGAGPAGMMAAISAALASRELQKSSVEAVTSIPSKKTTKLLNAKKQSAAPYKICLLEKNQHLARKMLLTGKGRCNLTNVHDLLANIEVYGEGQHGKFLYPAFNTFNNFDLIKLVESWGLATKIERGQRVFPVSDRAQDVVESFHRVLREQPVKIFYQFPVVKISKNQNIFRLAAADKKIIFARRVIISTGGKSYPQTGSTGDGYQLAENLGHHIVALRPALAALYIKNADIRSLAGLTLKNINFTVYANQEKQFSYFGEMLFTHQGITGPVVMKSSKYVFDLLQSKKNVTVSIDLKPALTEEVLSQRLEKEITSLYKKELATLLKELLPKALIPLLIKHTGLVEHRKNASLSTQDVQVIVQSLKNWQFKIDGVAPIDSAIVTAGGVDLSQINPKTMESKLVPGLYFAGELINLDGPSGGYNLQMAFSTGYLAGQMAVEAGLK